MRAQEAIAVSKPNETSETASTEEKSGTEEASTEETKESGKETEGTEGANESKETEAGEEELNLDRAKEKISRANEEAKGLRTRLRETEDKLANAKTPEEVEAIVKEMTEAREKAERSLMVENVALKFKLPDSLHKRLTGTTREELEADAKELAELFGNEGDDDELDLEGGLNPRSGDKAEPDDPRALAQKYGRKRRR